MSSSPLFVVITHIVKPEHREIVLQHIKSKVLAVRQQRGCTQLLIFEDANDPNKIIAFQTWEKSEHWISHLQSEEAQELTEMVKSFEVGFSIEKMTLCNI